MKWLHFAAAAILVACVFSNLAETQATTMVKFTNADMALLADAVVVARVDEVRTEEDARGMIHTVTTLDVEESWKGSVEANSFVSVRTLGGQIEGKRASIAGTAIFLRNEKTLLYLTWNEQNERWEVLGWHQGKYTVLERADGTLAAQRVFLKLGHSGLDVTDPIVKDAMTLKPSAQNLTDLRFNLERTLADHAKNGGGDPYELPQYKGIGR